MKPGDWFDLGLDERNDLIVYERIRQKDELDLSVELAKMTLF